MSKHYFDHFSLTQFILVKDVEMSASCNYCTKQKKSCVISEKSDKYNKYVHFKKLCFLSFNFLVMNVFQLLQTCEKIEKKQTALFNKKQHLFKAFQVIEAKEQQLCHHT